MISLITRLTNDRALAEDLAQETFLKVFRNLAAFDTKRRFSSWLFRIAHNTALDALRRRRPQIAVLDRGLESAPPADPAAPAAPDPVERQALARALTTALSQLRPEYRTAVALRYEQGLSFEDIGHVLGIPEVTARSHVHRARKELSRLLTAGGWQPNR